MSSLDEFSKAPWRQLSHGIPEDEVLKVAENGKLNAESDFKCFFNHIPKNSPDTDSEWVEAFGNFESRRPGIVGHLYEPDIIITWKLENCWFSDEKCGIWFRSYVVKLDDLLGVKIGDVDLDRYTYRSIKKYVINKRSKHHYY